MSTFFHKWHHFSSRKGNKTARIKNARRSKNINKVHGYTMNFVEVYTNAFKKPSYSSAHHIQYDYVLKRVLEFKNPENSIIDIGSGRGQIISILNANSHLLSNYKITSVDLNKFHDQSVHEFIKCDLSSESDRNNLLKQKYDILICTDVFEHLDKSFIESVIHLCSKLAKKCIFAIANHSDILNGVELHIIRENDIWWETILTKYFVLSSKEIHFGGRLYNYVAESKSL